MVMWEKSPQIYKEVYLEGKKIPINRGMALGKEIADALENDLQTGDLVKDLVLAKMPRYELMDQRIEAELGKGEERVPILIKPDSCRKDHTAFYEYKTGPDGNWNQGKVNRDTQMTFYATGLYLITGKIPTMELIHAPTEKDEEGRPSLVGDIKRYPTTRTKLDMMKMQVRMKKAWIEIGLMLQSELL